MRPPARRRGCRLLVQQPICPRGAKPRRRARGGVHGPRCRGGSRLRTGHDGEPAGEAGSRRVHPSLRRRPARAFVRRGFQVMVGERCGDHLVTTYLAKVNAMKRQFLRLLRSTTRTRRMSAVESLAGGSMAPMDLCRRLNCVLQRKVSPLQRETSPPKPSREAPVCGSTSLERLRNDRAAPSGVRRSPGALSLPARPDGILMHPGSRSAS